MLPDIGDRAEAAGDGRRRAPVGARTREMEMGAELL